MLSKHSQRVLLDGATQLGAAAYHPWLCGGAATVRPCLCMVRDTQHATTALIVVVMVKSLICVQFHCCNIEFHTTGESQILLSMDKGFVIKEGFFS